MPPTKPERGGCEPAIKEEPAVMPQEAPISIPKEEPIEVPAWPVPEKVAV